MQEGRRGGREGRTGFVPLNLWEVLRPQLWKSFPAEALMEGCFPLEIALT